MKLRAGLVVAVLERYLEMPADRTANDGLLETPIVVPELRHPRAGTQLDLSVHRGVLQPPLARAVERSPSESTRSSQNLMVGDDRGGRHPRHVTSSGKSSCTCSRECLR